MISHQIKVGGLKEGETAYLKTAADGTTITRQEVATVTTLSLADEKRALMIGTLAIVMCGEKYEVRKEEEEGEEEEEEEIHK